MDRTTVSDKCIVKVTRETEKTEKVAVHEIKGGNKEEKSELRIADGLKVILRKLILLND